MKRLDRKMQHDDPGLSSGEEIQHEKLCEKIYCADEMATDDELLYYLEYHKADITKDEYNYVRSRLPSYPNMRRIRAPSVAIHRRMCELEEAYLAHVEA
jgi:hypothetical protein